MLFQLDQITIPEKGQDSQNLIGFIGPVGIFLKRTGQKLEELSVEAVTPHASVIVTNETPEAVAEMAQKLIKLLGRWHPEMYCMPMGNC